MVTLVGRRRERPETLFLIKIPAVIEIGTPPVETLEGLEGLNGKFDG